MHAELSLVYERGSLSDRWVHILQYQGGSANVSESRCFHQLRQPTQVGTVLSTHVLIQMQMLLLLFGFMRVWAASLALHLSYRTLRGPILLARSDLSRTVVKQLNE